MPNPQKSPNVPDFAQRAQPSVGVVCFKVQDVLLIRRGQAPMAGAWSLPGGRIEFCERVEDAALRELKEETGIDALLLGIVDVVDGIFTSRRTGKQTRHYVLFDYVAKWVAGDLIAGDDAADAQWIALEQLDCVELWEETRRIILDAWRLVDAA